MPDARYRQSILRLLYNQGPLTRKQITCRLKQRLNALVATCNELELSGELVRLPSDHVRNVPLCLNPHRFAVIGLEHKRESAFCVLLSVKGEKLAERRYSLRPEEVGEARLERLMKILADFRRRHRGYSCIGIGFADIGIVDTARGVGVYSAHIPAWREVAISQTIEERFGVFNRIVDRVGASALDCLRLSPEEEQVRTSLQIYVGGGVGATILKDGQYLGEASPSSCQLGHTIVVPHGAKCHCGNRGCLETLVAVPAIVARIARATRGAISTQEQFLAEARRDNSTCVKALREAGEFLGIAIANVVTFTAVTSVMVRSVLCQAHPVFLETVRRTVRENVILPFREKVRVVANLQGEDSTAMGAAFYTQREFFEKP